MFLEDGMGIDFGLKKSTSASKFRTRYATESRVDGKEISFWHSTNTLTWLGIIIDLIKEPISISDEGISDLIKTRILILVISYFQLKH